MSTIHCPLDTLAEIVAGLTLQGLRFTVVVGDYREATITITGH